jgi:uncharacterized MAPEG superfamily protein
VLAGAIALSVARGVPDVLIADYVTQYLWTRVAYTTFYLGGVNDAIAAGRTAVYFGGVFILLKMYVAAAKA